MNAQQEPITIHNATKLWQLLELAIEDATALKADPRYTLDMGLWHAGSDKDSAYTTCTVCMAGAVMARQLNAKLTDNRLPSGFGDGIDEKLNAINQLRLGHVHNAYQHLHWRRLPDDKWSPELNSLCIAADDDSFYPQFNDFKAQRALAAALKELDI